MLVVSEAQEEPQPTSLPLAAVRIDGAPPPCKVVRESLSIAALTSRGSRTKPTIRLACTCMTKQPNDFEVWLAHHVAIGVSRFYLRVEGTPELAELLEQPRWQACVRATFAEAGVRDNGGHQTDRQMTFLNSAIAHARADGFTHMLHVDDDELVRPQIERRTMAGVAALMVPRLVHARAALRAQRCGRAA
jgi:hypothetical protein